MFPRADKSTDNRKPPKLQGADISGFVCPECMLHLNSSDALILHFESQHNNKAERFGQEHSGEDPKITEQRCHLLDEMSQHNSTLIKRISVDSRRMRELENIVDLVLRGTPLPQCFSFSNEQLKDRVDQFLMIQATHASTESMLEASKTELERQQREINSLKTELQHCHEVQVLQNGLTNENQILEEKLTTSEAQLRFALDEVQSLRLQLEATHLEKSTVLPPISAEASTQKVIEMLQTENAQLKEAIASVHMEADILRNRLVNQCTMSSERSAHDEAVREPLSGPESQRSSEERDLFCEQIRNFEQRLGDLQSLRESERAALTVELTTVKATLNQAVTDAAQSRNEAEQTISTLRAQLERLNAEGLSQSSALAGLNAEADQLRKANSIISKDLFTSEQRVQKLVEELADLRKEYQTERDQHAADREQLMQSLSTLQRECDSLRARCSELTTQYEEQLHKLNTIETELERSRTCSEQQIEEVRAQLSVSRKEADSLMERLIKAEDNSSILQEALSVQIHEVECLNKAIFELGRENQSLQMLRERVSTRQWVRDDDASACVGCHREFSISNRKHHCRNCGGIFCGNCSSNRASTASSKDPVRVCRLCYSELIKHNVI
ncbi:Early endosome antigen 1 [Paragonimus heterotremus]|uniref:Early endosome antigen 1 n=1 Tax=Paragonimus heterotremus TaxID=100268 RepID=A0A8J4SNN1_9TREM|nr:Early endosome antigen 1 [Paragonimus heterotremus]